MMPIRIAAGWSRDDGMPISLGIRYLTRPGWRPGMAQWSHQFVVFEFPDGTRVIHEALLSEGWSRKDYAKLDLWLAKDRRRHHAEVHWLPIAPEAVAAMYSRSCGWLGTRSYAVRQIVAFALAESLLGRWLGLSIRSGPEELICSEGACMLIGMAGPAWDLRECREQSWDSVSPQAAYNALIKRLFPIKNG